MIIQFANRVKKNEKNLDKQYLKYFKKNPKPQQANQQTKTFQVLFLSRAEIIFNNYPKEKRKKPKSSLQKLDRGVGQVASV